MPPRSPMTRLAPQLAKNPNGTYSGLISVPDMLAICRCHYQSLRALFVDVGSEAIKWQPVKYLNYLRRLETVRLLERMRVSACVPDARVVVSVTLWKRPDIKGWDVTVHWVGVAIGDLEFMRL